MRAPRRRAGSRADAGFTLVEAMIAGMLGILMAFPALIMLRDTYRYVDLVRGRLRLDQQARQVYSLLGNGTNTLANIGTNTGARGFTLVEGLHSRQLAPLGATLRSSSQFVLPDGGLTASGDSFPAVTVACNGVGNPIPDCLAVETHSVQGWVGSDPAITVTGQSAAVDLTLTDPFRAVRAGNQYATATEVFRSIYTLNVEANP
ncbi:MAG: hypothetical protein JO209_05645 [Acidisphaera sp.]|nr:hypothetical protein [Acidisphaera sp.]